MSHIAEVYAKDLGVKIGDPVITDHFFPGLPDKYITIQASNKMPAANYLYWDLVIHLIKPYLGDIKIVQVGGSDDKPVNGIDLTTLGNSYKQMNYVIKNAKAHCGCDSLPSHVASIYDIPSIALHFNLYKENSKPIWHKNNYCISIEPDFSKIKPSFSSNCNRINEIKPEQIAQAIIDQLNIKEKIKFKTIRIGSAYNQDLVEIVPNFFHPHENLVNKNINIKSEIHFNKENIINWCRHSNVNLFLDQVIDDGMIDACTNLKQVVFNYDAKHKDLDLSNFIKKLKNNRINLVIHVQDEKIFSDTSLKYFDNNVIRKNNIEPENVSNVECKFLSKKKFVSGGNIFNSEFSSKTLDNSNKFIYNEDSKLEIESLYLYVEE
tara:strand:- start:2690 stop:3823 length:1134 start_codon:yes stop_codon:yes gene_type:complete